MRPHNAHHLEHASVREQHGDVVLESNRGMAVLALGLVALLGIAGGVGFSVQRSAVVRRVQGDLERFADSVATDVDAQLDAGIEDARFLASVPAGDAERIFVALVKARSGTLQVRRLDVRGREVLRVEADGSVASVLQDKSSRYYFDRGMRVAKGGVYVSQLDLNVEHGEIEQPPRPVLRFVAPVFDEADRRAGVVVVNRDARPLLSKLERWARETSGHLYLIDDDSFIRHPDPKRAFAAADRDPADDRIFGRAAIGRIDGAPRVVVTASPEDAVVAATEDFVPLVLGLVGGALLAGLLLVGLWRYRSLLVERAQAVEDARTQTLTDAAAVLAHEVRNPLAAITNSAGLLRDGELSGDDAQLLEIVRSESRRLERILDDFVNLSRPRPLDPRSVELNALVRDVLDLAQRDPALSEPLVIERALAEEPLHVTADADLIRQVVWNLLLNAGQACRRMGGRRVAVRTRRTAASVVVEIEDDGGGPTSASDDLRGPVRGGLGLIIASGIVARHHGHLDLRQSVNGALAVVSLPAGGPA